MSDLLDDAAIDAGIRDLAWSRAGDRLVKEMTFRDFAEAMAHVNRVAEAAEAAGHHPDIAISWNRVTLTLWTHTAGGVTQNDLDMARTLDGLSG